MNRRKQKITALFLAAVLGISCTGCGNSSLPEQSTGIQESSLTEEVRVDSPVTEAASEESAEAVETAGEQAVRLAQEMSLEQKIGQMIMPAFRSWTVSEDSAEPVTGLNDSIRQEIEDCGFGGIILFAENFEDTEQTVRLIQDMQESAIRGKQLPLLIAVDQEGGRVARLAMGTTMPGNMALGAIGSGSLEEGKEAARQTGQIFGSELQALGIHIDFAPDMDVNNNPENPVIGVRSFSDDPELVAALGTAMMEGLQSENTATALKHFPGHGNTSTDSHIGLPVVDKTLEELRQCELIPFQKAIDAGTDIVMTAHIEYPQVETAIYDSPLTGNQIHLPATLSKTMITDVLRDEMGFEGVVVTDAMQMDAIAKNFPVEDAVKLAVNADADLLLMPVAANNEEGLQQLKQLITSVAQMVEQGDIDEEELTDSVERILELKIRRGVLEEKQYDAGGLENKIQSAKQLVGSREHHETERQLAERAVTVLKNEADILPLTPEKEEKLLVLCSSEEAGNAFQYGILRLKKEGQISEETVVNILSYDCTKASAQPGQKQIVTEEEIRSAVEEADVVLTESRVDSFAQLNPLTEADGWRTGAVDSILRMAQEADKRVIVISTGLPYDAARYTDMDGCVLCYGPRGIATLDADGMPEGIYGENIPAALDIVFGKSAAEGHLPVNIRKLSADYQITDQLSYSRGDASVK